MPRYDFVPPVLLRSEGDRGDDPALLDTLDKLIHVLVQLHLEGMVWEIVDLREGNIINARELVFLSLRVIHEKLIVPGQAQIDFLHALQSLSPPSSEPHTLLRPSLYPKPVVAVSVAARYFRMVSGSLSTFCPADTVSGRWVLAYLHLAVGSRNVSDECI